MLQNSLIKLSNAVSASLMKTERALYSNTRPKTFERSGNVFVRPTERSHAWENRLYCCLRGLMCYPLKLNSLPGPLNLGAYMLNLALLFMICVSPLER